MNIEQLHYFVTIVDCNCNLSEASKKIHISQPALSQMIKSFEEKENVLLFERSHGRLERLSPTGEIFYTYSLNLIEQYDIMMQHLREDATKLKGKIKIGIPPLVLSTVFSEVASELILKNPDIKFEIAEIGAYNLRKSLILQEIDIAILLKPTTMNLANIEEVLLVENELCAFMYYTNPLASQEFLQWSQLHNHPMAIFDSSFMIHHQLMRSFEMKKIKPNILITSASWDFLLRSTIRTSLVTILPSPIADCFSSTQVKRVKFAQPIKWVTKLL